MRERYLYETRNAGVGADGPNRDLYQERLEMSGIAGTSYEPYKRVNHHRLGYSPNLPHVLNMITFLRTQHCTMDSEGVIRVEPGKPGIEGRPLYYRAEDSWEPRHGGDERLGWSVRPTSAPAQSKPNWMTRDKQILVFNCYYQEEILSSQQEDSRIR